MDIDFSFSGEVISVVTKARLFTGRRIHTRLFMLVRELREGAPPLGIRSGRSASRGIGNDRDLKAGSATSKCFAQ